MHDGLHASSFRLYLKPNSHKSVYYDIKSLKKILDLDLNMYLVKKLLWKPSIQMMHYTTAVTEELTHKVRKF